MLIVTTELFLEQVKQLEMMYRARGAFDAAVGAQRHWEYIEAMGPIDELRTWHPCVYRDRGIEQIESFAIKDGQLVLHTLTGATVMLTPNEQRELFLLVLREMKLTSSDLIEIASHLWQEEKNALTDKEMS